MYLCRFYYRCKPKTIRSYRSNTSVITGWRTKPRAKRGLASNFAAPYFEKRDHATTAKFVACPRFALPILPVVSDTLLEQPGEGRPHALECEDPENSGEDAHRDPNRVQENVVEQDVHDHRGEQNQRQ